MEIQTKYGKANITVTGHTDGLGVWVDANSNCGDDPSVGFTINNVRYGVRADLTLWSDGTWQIGNEATPHMAHSYLYMTRPLSNQEPSASARSKAKAEILAVVNQWVQDHPEELEEARSQARDKRRQEIKNRLAELKEEEAELRRELGGLLGDALTEDQARHAKASELSL